jgi:hypothetical protein
MNCDVTTSNTWNQLIDIRYIQLHITIVYESLIPGVEDLVKILLWLQLLMEKLLRFIQK